jgi:hypothetical protein
MCVMKAAEGRNWRRFLRAGCAAPALLLGLVPQSAAAQATQSAPLSNGLIETLTALGLPPEAAADPALATSYAVAAGLAFAGILAAITGLRASRIARRVAREREPSHAALEARDQLERDGIGTRVVSMPCWALFDAQDAAYRRSVIAPQTLRIGIEAACGFGWERYLGDAGAFVGMTGFGASAPYDELYRHFGITPQAVIALVRARLGGG